jgi:hypothetical protein
VRRAAAALAALLLVSGCAKRGVVAEGWAPLGADGADGARRRAVEQAQRAAIERETGVALSSRVRVERGEAVEQSLTARSSGRVASYEVLSQTRDSGGWRARIRAVVEPGAPGLWEVSLSSALLSGIASGAREGFARGGVGVVAAAEVRVDGSAEDEAAPPAAGWPAWRARVRLTATRGGEVLAEAVGEAAAAEPGANAARARASERAASACAERLARKLVAAR